MNRRSALCLASVVAVCAATATAVISKRIGGARHRPSGGCGKTPRALDMQAESIRHSYAMIVCESSPRPTAAGINRFPEQSCSQAGAR